MEQEAHIKRGSEWRKWDLHVHTPASPLDHALGDNWDIYIERLIEAAQLHEITAIATADYFTIDGYKKLLNYYDSKTRTLSVKGKTGSIYLIPGIELRINNFNSDNESINLHVLFDPDSCSTGFIESNFLEKLKIDYRGSEYDLKKQNILAIGKSIADSAQINVGQSFSGISLEQENIYSKKALSAVTLNKRDIRDALKEIDDIFKNQNMPNKSYLVAVVGKGHGGLTSLKWFEDNKEFSRAGLLREDLTNQADIVFSNNQSDRAFYLGEDSSTPSDEIQVRFKRLKPCVWGSDAKDLDKLLHPSCGATYDYTWIKADISFEGLKQITYEPRLRVRVQKDNPNEEETFAKIDRLEINFPAELNIKDRESAEAMPFCIQGKQVLCFSSNLNSIIGGRGSGKSTIVHILYNLISIRDTERLAGVNSPLYNLQLGTKDVLSKVRASTKSDIPASTEFFLQNEVEKFAKDIGEMSELVRNRLYGLSITDDETSKGIKKLEEEWEETSTEFNDLIDAFDELARIDLEIASLKDQRETLEKQAAVIKSKEYKELRDEIEKIANQISAYTNYEKEYKQLDIEIIRFIRYLKELDWSKYEGQSIINALVSDLEKRKEELRGAFDKANKAYSEADYSTKLSDKNISLKRFLKEKGLSAENVSEITAATQKISDLGVRIKTLERERIPHQERYDQRNTSFDNYRAAYSSYKEVFEKVTKRLQTNLDELKLDDPQINAISFNIIINNQMLKDAVAEFIKASNIAKTSLRADDIQSVLFSDDDGRIANMVSDKEKILEAVNNCKVANMHTQILKDLINNPVFIEKMHLRLQKYCFNIKNIQVQTKLGQKLLQNTSFGERCGIVMAIILAAGTNPIVIDQPEDNLDGKYVSKVLVPLVRAQKQRRQIILITRDANIAIGGDSEMILILDKANGKTMLSPATIEDKSMRSSYIWILDGGKVAFQKREQKYCI